MGIDHGELDPELQVAILETYEKTRKKPKKGSKWRSKNKAREYSDDESVTGKIASVPSVPRHQSITAANRIAESRPAAQIIPNSSLGIALGNVARVSKDPGDSDDPSDTSSEYESSVYSTATSTRSYSTSDSRSKRRHQRHHHRSKSKQRSKRKLQRRSKSRSSIQPIPPKDYDRSADSRAYSWREKLISVMAKFIGNTKSES